MLSLTGRLYFGGFAISIILYASDNPTWISIVSPYFMLASGVFTAVSYWVANKVREEFGKKGGYAEQLANLRKEHGERIADLQRDLAVSKENRSDLERRIHELEDGRRFNRR